MEQVFHKVFFDFDSTLIRAESLDVLAEMKGIEKEVRVLTERSMNGEVSLQEMLPRKMSLLRPSSSDIRELVRRCEGLFVEDAREVIRALRFLNKEIFILSSNFHPIVDPLVSRLGILSERVLANDLYFDERGEYAGINMASPLCTDTGKAVLLREHTGEGERVVFVGDGSSDVCAKGVADLFVGFGGVVRRSFVEERADVYITSSSMAALLPIILQPDETLRLRKEQLFVGAREGGQG